MPVSTPQRSASHRPDGRGRLARAVAALDRHTTVEGGAAGADRSTDVTRTVGGFRLGAEVPSAAARVDRGTGFGERGRDGRQQDAENDCGTDERAADLGHGFLSSHLGTAPGITTGQRPRRRRHKARSLPSLVKTKNSPCGTYLRIKLHSLLLH